MTWAPELFSAPALQQVLDRYGRERLRSVPFFDGLLAGEPDALIDSFAGAPEVHHPTWGRFRGEPAFLRFVDRMNAWLAQQRAVVEHVNFLVTDARGIEEVVLRLDGDDLPFAIACDHAEDERIVELRLYFGGESLAGHRPPLLQPNPDLRVPDRVGASGDLALCTVTDDGRVCALEYNAGAATLSPTAGLAVYERGGLADTRVYT